MQQDNNIAEQLRNLDSGLEPDLDNMDTHWMQMEAMLQPTAIPVKKAWPKWMLNTMLGSAAVLMIAGFWYFSNDAAKSKNAAEGAVLIEKTPASQPITPANQTDPGLVPDSVTVPVPTNGNVNSNGNGKDAHFSDDDANSFGVIQASLDSLKLNFTPCDNCPVKDSVAEKSPAERQDMLNKLLLSMVKPVQEFTVDNTRDTFLIFEEGSALQIPANSLGGNTGVQFEVKEYYKSSDIVLNKLSTLSDSNQLISGGMLHIRATVDGKEVAVDPAKPMRLYMSDTSDAMKDMQLFNGEVKKWNGTTGMDTLLDVAEINWVPQNRVFSNKRQVVLVRVLNLVDMPCSIKQKEKGLIGYFTTSEHCTISRDQLKEKLKEKYGYHKVVIKDAEWWWLRHKNISWEGKMPEYNSYYGTKIGDSVWMEKALAEKYKLIPTASKIVVEDSVNFLLGDQVIFSGSSITTELSSVALNAIQKKFSVDVSKLGWINCDRFYSDSRKKVLFAVDLGDNAVNYQTMLVFDGIKSAMNGYVSGNQVFFNNVPEGEKVKVISIGIDKHGKTVYSLTNTITSSQPLAGVQFESTSVPGLKTALSKMDR